MMDVLLKLELVRLPHIRVCLLPWVKMAGTPSTSGSRACCCATFFLASGQSTPRQSLRLIARNSLLLQRWQEESMPAAVQLTQSLLQHRPPHDRLSAELDCPNGRKEVARQQVRLLLVLY